MKTVDDVIAHFETITALAEALGVTTQAISQWKEDGLIPHQRAFQIQVLTDGKFTVESLAKRPPRQSAARA